MCLNKENSIAYVEVRVFRPVGSIPAFRLMVFAASTVFGVKIAVASPDAAGGGISGGGGLGGFCAAFRSCDALGRCRGAGALAAAPSECGNNQRRGQNQS